MGERSKMEAGAWYCCLDPELDALRADARRAVHEHNTLAPDRRGAIGPPVASAARLGRRGFRGGADPCRLRDQSASARRGLHQRRVRDPRHRAGGNRRAHDAGAECPDLLCRAPQGPPIAGTGA
ncbi:maltose acetyltransferase domain-containing protein [Sulfitobacter sp. D35]|uniref:maltose acetyltransferase domain-containing protein n=1 Tax=Sulfitobacter sp. D35 TaxID=3083252 RepID=UPI003990B325